MDGVVSLPGIHEPLSSMSHLAGAIVFAWLAYYLLRPLWNTRAQFFSVLIFVSSAVVLLAVSATYHMLPAGSLARKIMLNIDHVAIFFLIAGTFTPIHFIAFKGWERWGVLALVWAIAIVGSVLRIRFFETISPTVNAALYLGMGWIGAVTACLLWRAGHKDLILFSVMGGLCYSLGAISNAVKWPHLIPGIWGPHETLHFFVLAGLSFHWAVVARIIHRFVSQNRGFMVDLDETNQEPVSEQQIAA